MQWAYTSFNPSYQGHPPWGISGPQPAIVALAEEGRFVGRVLDVGCGTGENALYLASRGHPVLGIDGAATAIERAQAKARRRGLPAEFVVADAFDLIALGQKFDTVLGSARRQRSSTPSTASGRSRDPPGHLRDHHRRSAGLARQRPALIAR